MSKTITTIILTALAILFAMQNFDHVPVYFFWGKGTQIRLIFVIAIAGVGGYLIRHFIGIAREDALKRRLQGLMMNSVSNQRKKKKADVLEEEEL
ncbi:MAG: hypothetical protein ABII06_09905 [Pseudomonadota bacterium]